MTSRPSRLIRRPFAAAMLALAVAAPAATADTITVTSTADSGTGSLRDALAGAAAGDTIVLPPGDYAVTSDDLGVTKGVTIRGAGARRTILHGDSDNRVFNLTAPTPVAIERLTVTDGNATEGGGIESASQLTLTSVALIGNTSTGIGRAGGIRSSKPLTVVDSLVAHNVAGGDGGGLQVSSSVTVDITNTTIADNHAGGDGGGFEVTNATPTTITLTNDTVVGNSAGHQGGVFRNGSGNTVKYRNTIFSGNSAPSALAGPTCYEAGGATNMSLGGNRSFGDVVQCKLTAGNDVNNATLNLGPLANNGGPTDTMQLGAGSQALDADPNDANCPLADQRGVPRPQGTLCDAGALERSTPTASLGTAGGVTDTRATVPGFAGTQGIGGTATLEYGVSTAYGKTRTVTLHAKTGQQGIPFALTKLLAETTYHARLTVTTPDGTAQSTDTTFKTRKGCTVPKLKGLTLAKAKAKLTKAHCRLGKVKHATKGTPRRHPVVVKQKPKAGAVRPRGTKVGVTLSPKKQ